MRNPVLLPRWAALLALAMLNVAGNALAREKAITNTELERVADAVDGVESSHGMDASMWRAKPEGPQGPIQVSQKAATDVGGGTASTLARTARWSHDSGICSSKTVGVQEMPITGTNQLQSGRTERSSGHDVSHKII